MSNKGSFLFLLVVCAAINISLSYNWEVDYLEVKLGGTVNSACTLENSVSPVDWYINQTVYDLARLPADYSFSWNKKNQVFIIKETKLWMNNTLYGCYDYLTGQRQDMFILNITFEFEGPEDVEAKLGDDVSLTCSSTFLIDNNISVIWNINGISYNPTRLPGIYMQKEDGLYSHSISKEQNNTSFQCLFYSEKLWKNDFYRSKTANLIVTSSYSDLLHPGFVPRSVKKFKFNYQRFIFGEQFTIAWNDAKGCTEPFNYYLVRSSPNMPEVNTTNLHKWKNVTLSKEELIKDNTVYKLYILASVDGIQVCSITETYLLLNPDVETSLMYIMQGKDTCFQNNHLDVVWPFSLAGEDYCICDDWMNFSTCDCIDDTIYDVDGSSQNKICWKNIAVNHTKIYFVNQTLSYTEAWLPYITQEILLSYELIIIERPGSPDVYKYGSVDGYFQLFVKDIYTGHSQITQYNVNVTDITQNFYTFVKSKEGTGNSVIIFPDEAMAMMNENCKPQKVSVTSTNIVGNSSATFLNLSSGNNYVCDCAFSTIQVNLMKINVTSESLTLQIICKTTYTNSEKISFIFTPEPNDAAETKDGNCSQTIQFNHLKSGHEYSIYVQWRHCVYEVLAGPFHTDTPSINEEIAILAGSISGTIVVCVLFLVALGVAIYCCQKCGSRKKSAADQAT